MTKIKQAMYKVNHQIMKIAVCSAVATGGMVTSAFAAPAEMDVFEKSQTILTSLYKQIVSITTAAAVVMIAVAACFMLFSNNQKTVDTAKEWMKRILLAWLIINGVGFIMATLKGYEVTTNVEAAVS